MNFPADPNGENSHPQRSQRRRRRRVSLSPITFYLLITVLLILMLLLAWGLLARFDILADIPLGSVDDRAQIAEQISPTAEIQEISVETSVPMSTPIMSDEAGMLVLSIREGLNAHLFAYRPVGDSGDTIPLTRLTAGEWDDITPALHTEQRILAFASNRRQGWHIYLWDIEADVISRLTEERGYKASPTWSPDGMWLAYERYFDNNLEIYIQQAAPGSDPIQLTDHLAADYSPAWSPTGRLIAFISTRSGREQIWLADLDNSGEGRFIAVEHRGEARARRPVWTVDGRYLLWSAIMEDGMHRIVQWDSQQPEKEPIVIANGDYPALSADGEILYTTIETPDQTYLTAYMLEHPDLLWLPLMELPGSVESLSWIDLSIDSFLTDVQLPEPTPLWYLDMHLDEGIPGGRWEVVNLEGVEAPVPKLHDRVDEAFVAFRAKLTELTGWDLLADLENAYVPLTSPLSPKMGQDWLYTGRAFTFKTLPINAGWMAVVREDYGVETYWRVYLKTRAQDGSQGVPLHALPWNFDARYRAEPSTYEQGGEISQEMPPGYWLDMTELAKLYGWQRLPALSLWRAVYTDARFNEFVRTDGLDWQTAMLELYPQEIVLSPTAIPTATPTPTVTSTPTITDTPTITQTPTITPTPTVTLPGWYSPTPSSTPFPTFTITPTNTFWPTPTP